MASGAERFHALDAVRGGALVLGVFFHAAMSFMPGPQIWVVMDEARSTEISVLFFVLHILRMTVFFVLAGFFARMLLTRRGVGGLALTSTIRGRPRRSTCVSRRRSLRVGGPKAGGSPLTCAPQRRWARCPAG